MECVDLQAAKRKDPLRGKGGVRMIRRMDADSWTGLVLACMVMLCYRAALRSGDLTGSLVAGDIIWEMIFGVSRSCWTGPRPTGAVSRFMSVSAGKWVLR